MPNVFITNRGAKRIRSGHLWCYKSDIKKIEASGGDVVSVFDEAKNFVGKAFYSDSSEIALRFFTTKNEEINDEYWHQRLSRAINFRFSEGKIRLDSDTNSARLINAEGDLLPSLIVDYYDGVLVIQTLSQATEKLKSVFVDALRKIVSPKAIVERNDSSVRSIENLPLKKDVIFGKVESEIVIKQNGLRFFVSPLEGQKTGAFLDQRENYLLARKFAKGRALDCFSFAGGFALNMASSCEEIVAVDISEKAIDLAKRNAELNDSWNIRFQVANVFDFLRELEKAKERFDTIVLDPPAFAKNRESLKRAISGYKEINLRAMKILNKDGILITCSCSHHFTEEIFLETLLSAALDARKRLHLIAKSFQASDHPILLSMPETLYLKCFILRVFD